MSLSPTANLLRHLRHWAAGRGDDPSSDRELLRRFAEQHDEAAFAALVRRHGPMVLSVCRRILHRSEDAEDAFQATFLVLFRRSGTHVWRDCVGGWLHRVATRIALRLRADAARRAAGLPRAEQSGAADPLEQVSARELFAAFDEELARLPQRYRLPLVLCFLQNKTQEEAAAQLACSLSTIRRRLEQGRRLLHRRLTRRGLELPAALGAVLLAREASAGVPAALRIALEQTVRGTVPARVAVLADGMLKTAVLSHLKATAAVALLVGVLAAGAGWVASHLLASKPPEAEIAASAAPDQPKSEKAERTDLFGDPLPPGALVRMGTVRFRHPTLIGSVAYSRDGKILAAAGHGGIVRLYDPATGKTLRQLEAQAHQYPSLAFAPDGKTLACLGSSVIHIWDVESGKELHRFAVQASDDQSAFSINPLVFSPDGKMLAAMAPDCLVRVWDAKTGKELAKLRGHQTQVCCLAFSPDGKTLFSASDRGAQAGSLYVWNVATGAEKKRVSLNPYGSKISPTPLSFSPDGKTLALASWQWLERKHAKGKTIMQAHAIALLDLETGKVRRKFEPMVGRFRAASFSADGKIITAMNDEHRVGSGTTQEDVSRIKGWDTDTGKQVFDLPAPPTSTSFWGGAGTLLAFAPDARHLAAAAGSSLHVWDLRQERELAAKPNLHHSQVSCVALSPDGLTLASASADHTIALWDAATGKQRQRLRGHEGEVSTLVFSADGKLLASASHNLEQSVRLWDVADGKEIRRYEVPSLPVGDGSFWSIVTWISFTENGKVLTAFGSDGTLRRWDTATGKELFNQRIRGLPALPKGHEASLHFTHDDLVFSRDGRVLAFSIIKTIYIVDVAAGQVLFSYENDAFFNSVLALSPDGKTLLRRAGNSARLVEVASGQDYRQVDLSEPVARALFSPEGRRIIAQSITAAAFSPDGRIVAVSAGDAHASIRLFEVATGKELLRFEGHEAHVPSLVFSADGTKLASGQWDSTALIWDVSAARRKLDRKDLSSRDLERLWTELRDPDAVKAHAALWTLVAAPDQAVPFLKEHLHPVPRVTADRLQRLIADLDADDFARRDEASRELAKLGSEAEPALRQALEAKPSLETRRRVQSLLDSMKCQTEMKPDALRQLRAIQVLEQIGSPEARRILAALAQGAPAAPATRDAAAAVVRLDHGASK